MRKAPTPHAIMGVTHSMDEAQVVRISTALKQSADSIQGINSKFDIVDEHWQGVQTFNTGISTRIEGTLASFQRLDKAINARFGRALNTVKSATDELTGVMKNMVNTLEGFDMQREMNQLPKAVIPMMIPLVILMIELAVANAYLGILLTRLPDIGDKYSSYLLGNAAIVLLGLLLSMFWLVSYRGILSLRTRRASPGHITRAPTVERTADDEPLEAPAPVDEEEEEEVDKGRRRKASVPQHLRHCLMSCSDEMLQEEMRRRMLEVEATGLGRRLDDTVPRHPSSSRSSASRLSTRQRSREEIQAISSGPRQRRRPPSEGGSKENSPEVSAAQPSPSSRTEGQREKQGVKFFWSGGFQAQALWGAKKSPPSPTSDTPPPAG